MDGALRRYVVTDFRLRIPGALRLWLAVALAAALSACAALDGRETATKGPPPPEPVAEEPAPAPQRRPDAEPDATEQKTVVAAIPPEEPVAETTKEPAVSLDSLIGLAFADVESLLGPADERLDAPPGKTWKYHDAGCNLAISFYPDVEALSYRVLSYKIESGTEDEGLQNHAQQRCRERFAERLAAGL